MGLRRSSRWPAEDPSFFFPGGGKGTERGKRVRRSLPAWVSPPTSTFSSTSKMKREFKVEANRWRPARLPYRGDDHACCRDRLHPQEAEPGRQREPVSPAVKLILSKPNPDSDEFPRFL